MPVLLAHFSRVFGTTILICSLQPRLGFLHTRTSWRISSHTLLGIHPMVSRSQSAVTVKTFFLWLYTMMQTSTRLFMKLFPAQTDRASDRVTDWQRSAAGGGFFSNAARRHSFTAYWLHRHSHTQSHIHTHARRASRPLRRGSASAGNFNPKLQCCTPGVPGSHTPRAKHKAEHEPQQQPRDADRSLVAANTRSFHGKVY